ncbi:MAG: hypothetical protein ER33_07945 [Cyanobium sp. CACIAM 14]|nr:MAG: hypothetical protein ER33_07945 [Cyanobium sp. CACIAM 14]
MATLPSAALLAGSLFVAVTVLSPDSARASGTTFSFDLTGASANPAAPTASASKSFFGTPASTAQGETLTLVFQNALRPDGSSKPVSATADGLCIYKAGGTGLNDAGNSNCGLGRPGNGSDVLDQNAIELFFDRQVELVSYQYGALVVGQGNPLITWGAPYSPMVSTETLFDKRPGTSYAFDNPFVINAYEIISIGGTGGGRGSSTTEALLSQLVVRTVPTVPGPLPLLGAGAAFAWSRRLRSRLQGVGSR